MDYIKRKPRELGDCSSQDKDRVQKYNNEQYLNGYYILKDYRAGEKKLNQDEFNKVCFKIREFDKAYRGEEGQRLGIDTVVRKMCEKMGYTLEQIAARRKEEPEDHAKAAANDREPAYQEPVDMFSNSKQVRLK